MKIDFSRGLRSIHGVQLWEVSTPSDELSDGDRGKVTLRSVAVSSLLAADTSLDGKEKACRYELAHKIQNDEDPVDLSLDEAALVKDLIGDRFPPLIVGQAWKILDPK